MEPNNLIGEGLNLMLFGMGFVFVFLTLLVFATGLMSRLVTKYIPEAVPVARSPRQAAAASASVANDKQLIAVISAAVKKYRSDHPR